MPGNEEKVVVEWLKKKVPDKVQVSLPANRQGADELLENANENATSVLLGLLRNSEEKRIEQQKPLLYTVCVFVGIQLLAFNGIIFYLLIKLAGTNETEIIREVLGFLKYYVGAVLVELIGMMVFIARSTFASFSKSIIDKVLPDQPKRKKNPSDDNEENPQQK